MAVFVTSALVPLIRLFFFKLFFLVVVVVVCCCCAGGRGVYGQRPVRVCRPKV